MNKEIEQAAKEYAIQFKTYASSEGLENIANDFKAGWEACQQSTPPTPQGSAVWVDENYELLFDRVKDGKRVVCYILNDRMESWDICTIRNTNWQFQARGIGYSGYMEITDGAPNKIEFIQHCNELKVQWLHETASEQSVKPVGVSAEDVLTEDDCKWLIFYGHTKDKRITIDNSGKGLDYAFNVMFGMLKDSTRFDYNGVEKLFWDRIKLLANQFK